MITLISVPHGFLSDVSTASAVIYYFSVIELFCVSPLSGHLISLSLESRYLTRIPSIESCLREVPRRNSQNAESRRMDNMGVAVLEVFSRRAQSFIIQDVSCKPSQAGSLWTLPLSREEYGCKLRLVALKEQSSLHKHYISRFFIVPYKLLLKHNSLNSSKKLVIMHRKEELIHFVSGRKLCERKS